MVTKTFRSDCKQRQNLKVKFGDSTIEFQIDPGQTFQVTKPDTTDVVFEAGDKFKKDIILTTVD